MSQLKKALEKAKAERLSQAPIEETRGDQQPEAAGESAAPVCYTRTRVIDVPLQKLLARKVVEADEGNTLSDQFKRFRTRLLSQTRPRKWNMIQVTGFGPGEGKSLVAVNLAIALARYGGKLGLIDGDIYGPNIPIMLGIQAQLKTDGEKIVPAEKYGIQVVSMGFLTTDDAPVIWRGPMLHGVIEDSH